ncbi:MAG: TrkH family potassium uptake protein [Bacillota bacterium]
MQINRFSEAGDSKRLNPSPAQILVFGFAAVILLGTLLLSMPFSSSEGKYTPFIDALFTSTSAVCVTGLVVVDTGTYWSAAGQAIILLLIQVGGLGFMTMATFFFLIMGKKIGLKTRMVMQASFNQNNLQGIVNLGKHVLIFTFVVEVLFATVLATRWGFEMDLQKALWYGFFHSVSAFNNAGFDLFGGFRSLTGYAGDIVVNLSITTLIILGGIGFGVVMEVMYLRKNKNRLHTHTKLVLSTTSVLIAAGTLLFFVFEYGNTLQSLSFSEKLLASYFQSVTPRTAGYNTLDIGGLHSYTQVLIIMLMFIGASPGSTGGGIKTTTLAIMTVSVLSLSRGQTEATVFKRSISQDQIAKSVAIIFMAVTLVAVVSTALMITEGVDNYLLTLFETVSAFSTVGLTMGLTPALSEAGKILIILTMFLGRVGTMTMVLAFSARNKSQVKVIYPKGKIMVG